jgi:hypothetical protein
MTIDEAKGLFALMGWKWQELPLSKGNAARGQMDAAYQDLYEVFVNEVMEGIMKHRAGPAYQQNYEALALDRCLTRYAELYTACIAEGGHVGTRPRTLSKRP